MTTRMPGGDGVPKRDPLPTWPPFGAETLPFGAEMLPFGSRLSMSEMRTLEQWRTAEARLYPLIMVDPDLFEAAVTMVAEVVHMLRAQCETVEDLLDLDVGAVVARCHTARRVASYGFNPVVAVNAARARRWLELNTMPHLALRRGFLDGGR